MDASLRVDTHVHLHDCYDETTFLDAAATNLEAGNTTGGIRSAICFTEVHGTNRFASWANGSLDAGDSGWSLNATQEPNSLLARHADGRQFALIAGRQIECREGVEVLALGRVEDMSKGRPVREVLDLVSAEGAIPVLPWGFLKWSGRRGKLIDSLLEEVGEGVVFGDNGARLAGSSEPRHLQQARKRGFPVLPGTDPFPFPWDAGRVGSYGLECSGKLSPETPFADFKRIVLAPDFRAQTFGERLGIYSFLRNQVAIQLQKRFKARPA